MLRGTWMALELFRGSQDARCLEFSIGLLIGAVRTFAEQLRAYTRLDTPLAIIVGVYLVAFVPIIPRATDNPQFLACCINDEPMLTMALDGMLVTPYDDPYTFLLSALNGTPLPSYWKGFNYAGAGWYYGGLYPGLAFLAYAPLRALGFSAFPIAPIVLRSLSAIGGLLALMITYNFGRY